MGKRGRRTADPEAAQAERRELIEKLERGFQQVQESDEYRRYLDTVSRFHRYSISNTILIWMQHPDATHVAGFHTWLSLGRHVRKGEKGIRIFAPMAYRKTVATTNDDTGDPDQEEISQLRFRAVSVFDVSQTEGEELPQPPVTRLTGGDTELWKDLAAIASAEGLTVSRGINLGGAGGPNGFYHRANRLIWVDSDLAPAMASKTLCHEIGHHFAEHIDTRHEHETVAESVAYIVLGHFGIDASNYSFGYLAGWSDPATFKAALASIQAIASRIIDFITERRVSREGDLAAGLPLPGHEGSETWLGERAGPDLHAGL